MKAFVLALSVIASCNAAPWLGAYGLYGYPYAAYHVGGAVHSSIGGYKAVAGEGGAVHEVPGILPAPALLKQESAGGVTLTSGAGVGVHYIGKREAEAEAGLVLGGYSYGLPYALPYAYHAPALVATGGAVPVAVGGYKAVAGEGGAVHEVPALFGAPALAKQESDGGVSLTTGTGGVLVYGK